MPRLSKSPSWPDPAPLGARHSLVAADLEIEGDVVSQGSVDIHGRVRGTVRAPEVVVGEDGSIDGAVSASALTVLGRITGSIEARALTLAATSMVRADVLHEEIAIATGARLEGRLIRPD